MKKRYVIGFFYDIEHKAMLLIEKTKPDWQRGLVNGIGGSIEPGETLLEAMIREFKEETGVDTESSDWLYVGKLSGQTWEMIVFRGEGVLDKFVEECDEGRVTLYDEMPPNMETTARWLYFLCLDNTIRGTRFEGYV